MHLNALEEQSMARREQSLAERITNRKKILEICKLMPAVVEFGHFFSIHASRKARATNWEAHLKTSVPSTWPKVISNSAKERYSVKSIFVILM